MVKFEKGINSKYDGDDQICVCLLLLCVCSLFSGKLVVICCWGDWVEGGGG